MKIAPALGMPSNMSPPTCKTPSYVGAVATTLGKSKLMALMCGYDWTMSDIMAPVPPPTSTNDLMPRKPSLYPAIISLAKILVRQDMLSLKVLFNSGLSDAK